MAQSDQVVQNATFPTVRGDINDNLAALFSQSSGNSAPAVTVAFQPWIDSSSSPPVWKVRNGSNSAWITVGVLDANFQVGGITPIANGGTGATTATAALAALLPSQGGNTGKALITDGSLASWGVVAAGASVQVLTASGTYTPTTGKTTFLVFATGGGGGGGSADATNDGGCGGGAGTAVRLYTSSEMGSTAAVTVGAAGAAGVYATGTSGGTGGTTTFDPAGTGLTITGVGGGGGVTGVSTGLGGTGGSATNSQFNLAGNSGSTLSSRNPGVSFWAGGVGRGGAGGVTGASGSVGLAGGVFILEW